jgi:hypothetical protein
MMDEDNTDPKAAPEYAEKARGKGGSEPWATAEQLRWFQEEGGRFKAARDASALDPFWDRAFETWNQRWPIKDGPLLKERVKKLRKVSYRSD